MADGDTAETNWARALAARQSKGTISPGTKPAGPTPSRGGAWPRMPNVAARAMAKAQARADKLNASVKSSVGDTTSYLGKLVSALGSKNEKATSASHSSIRERASQLEAGLSQLSPAERNTYMRRMGR